MTIATGLPCLLALSFAVSARTQKPETPPDPDAQLLLDLGNDERSAEAVRTLTHRGAAGVATLIAAIRDPKFHADEHRLAVAVYALGKLGDQAVPAVLILLDELSTAQGDVLRNLLWAMGEIGPKAQALGHGVLARLRALDPNVDRSSPVRPGWDYQEWAFACRRTELGVDPSPSEVAQLLRGTDHASLVAAAGFLCRAEPSATWPIEELLAAWTRTERLWRMHGEGFRRATLELARATARHAADTPEGAAARAALIFHFDVEVRQQAVMQIGQNPGTDLAAAVKALQLALTDGSLHVRREAVTALGMIGPPAADALPALQGMAADPDVQIRGRAAAAARAIGRNGK